MKQVFPLKRHFWRYKSQIFALLIWIVIGISANIYMHVNNLSPVELVDAMSEVLSDTWYGPLLYILAYFLRPLTFFPGTPMTMLGGYVYGLWWGFLYAFIAGLLSLGIPYVIGYWFSGEGELQEVLREHDNHTSSLIQTMRENPFQVTLTTRFLYLPYDLVNFAAGSLHISFWSFIAATALGNVMNAFMMVSIGASLDVSLSEGEFTINPILITFSLMIWLVSYGITRYLKRHNKETSAR